MRQVIVALAHLAMMGFCYSIGYATVFVPGSLTPGTATTQVLNVCSLNGLMTAGDSLNYRIGELSVAALAPPIDHLYAEIGGTDCAQSVATYPTYDVQLYSNKRTRNIAAFGCGHNSLIHGTTPAQTYIDILAYVALAKATGYTVAVWTLTDASDLVNADRVTLNGLITGGAAVNDYTVLDVASSPELGCDGCASNLTYFDPDGTHYTAEGRALKATYLTAALQAFGFP